MTDFDKFMEELIKKQENDFKIALSNMVEAKEYVKIHKHINYCEVVVDKEGLIAEAHPSHTEFLRMYAGLSQEELMDLCEKHNDIPINTLLEHTGCVAVWYNHYMYEGNLSDKQKEALAILIKNDIVDFNLEDCMIY